MTNQYITREKLARINDSLPDDLGVHHLVALCNAAIQDYIDSITDGVELPEPIGYLAWLGGKPCWDGDDCVCEDAVYPIDADDDRESKAIYTPDQLRQAQAMARAKLLAELGQPQGEVVAWAYRLRNASGWGSWITTVFGGRKPQQANWQEIEVRPLVYGDAHHQEEAVAVADGTFNHNCPLGTPLYTRPLPAQDVNAELVSVPNGWKLVPIEPDDWVYSDKVIGHDCKADFKDRMRSLYIAMLSAAPRPPQEKKES